MKNVFTGLPVEFHIPNFIDTVFVSDFYSNEVQGGAELTTDALISYAPSVNSIFKLHSGSLTEELLLKNRNKTFVLTNFVSAPLEGLMALYNNNINYYVIEYDYKYCRFRSEGLHLMQTKKACDCYKNEQIKNMILALYSNSKAIFWMSEGQKKQFLTRLPELSDVRSYVLSSVFDEFTIQKINELYDLTKSQEKINKVAILSKDNASWIKGIESTEAFLKLENKEYINIPKKPYFEFLEELSKYKTFCFRPSDKDTCPRITIEAKLLGLDLILNKNVQHKDEFWFNQERDYIMDYLRKNPSMFWNVIYNKSE